MVVNGRMARTGMPKMLVVIEKTRNTLDNGKNSTSPHFHQRVLKQACVQ